MFILFFSNTEATGEILLFRFVTEQVSHNPPVSAFRFECPQQNFSVNGNLSIKAKFMGMYVGVTLGGDMALELPAHNHSQDRETEKYEMSYDT